MLNSAGWLCCLTGMITSQVSQDEWLFYLKDQKKSQGTAKFGAYLSYLEVTVNTLKAAEEAMARLKAVCVCVCDKRVRVGLV